MKKSRLKRSYIKRKKYGQSTHRDYSRKIDYVKALQNKAEALWKKLGKLLHGNECEVKNKYPHISIEHTDIIQGDHCITRANKYFFFDIRNHSSVCSACNQAKHYKTRGVDEAITELVKARDPKWYKDALWLHQTREANPSFSQVWWLEEIITDLEEQIKEER